MNEKMNRWETYRAIRRNVRLAGRRSPMFEANRTARFMMLLAGSFLVIYMMLGAVGMSLVANGSRTFTAPQFFFALAPFMLAADFLMRLFTQHTPSQMIRPYLLLPMRKYACVDSLIITDLLSLRNTMWLLVSVPFSVMSVVFVEGVWVSVWLVLVFQVLVACNSMLYMLGRTLTTHRAWLAVVPAGAYALMYSPWLLGGISLQLSLYSRIGTLVSACSPLLLVALGAIAAVLFMADREVQYRCLRSEAEGSRDIRLRRISRFTLPDSWGITGEYLRLEVKMLLRNRNMRHTFISQSLFVVLLSLLNSFTDIYDDDFSTLFWSSYPFLLTSINLVRIMCSEGNYIECLLTRKETVLQLLRAKYLFYCSLQPVPLVLMLPTVFTGKYTLLTLVSLMLFTAGPVYCLLMQLAVSNRTAIPLNTRLTRKTGVETDFRQTLCATAALFAPMFIIPALRAAFGQTGASWAMLAAGAAFILTHRWWTASIYRRMMRRRYRNVESFMASR